VNPSKPGVSLQRGFFESFELFDSRGSDRANQLTLND
jgi:hypothetical protein